MMDEWRLRESTGAQLGMRDAEPTFDADDGRPRRASWSSKTRPAARRIVERRSSVDGHAVEIAAADPEQAHELARPNGDFELVIVSLLAARRRRPAAVRRSCAPQDATRHLPILLMAEEGDHDRAGQGARPRRQRLPGPPVDRNELLARVRTQIRRRRYQERLRADYERSLSLALTDSLTGLYNRRYLLAPFRRRC